MASPTATHLEATKRVLRYIRGTLHHVISFTLGPLSLIAFLDADWVGDPSDRHSTSGLLVFLGPSPVSWSTKKQPTISHSFTEAEYRALASTATKISWLRILFKELRIFLPYIPVLWCDNVFALALATNPVFHSRNKHIEVDYHYVREKVLCHDLRIRFVFGKDNLADIFTKPLPAPSFLFQRGKLMMDFSPCRLRGDVEDTNHLRPKPRLKQATET